MKVQCIGAGWGSSLLASPKPDTKPLGKYCPAFADFQDFQPYQHISGCKGCSSKEPWS